MLTFAYAHPRHSRQGIPKAYIPHMNYYIRIYSNKPKEDINSIVESVGYRSVNPDRNVRGGIGHFLVKTQALWCILTRMKSNDTLLIQYPLKKFYTLSVLCAHLKGARVVTLIHDLGCFRRKKLTVPHEVKRLNRTDFLIVHNQRMADFLTENGLHVPMHLLGIFDYLSDAQPRQTDTKEKESRTVAYAGGLSHARNAYIYTIGKHIRRWTLELFGKSFEPDLMQDAGRVHFRGQFPPDELIRSVDCDFGLVWDGDSFDECRGKWGEYLKFNNPHKTSFYLRAHMPVIVWSQSAMAPFVRKHDIGLCIDSLTDIDRLLESLPDGRYEEMKRNAVEMSGRLATGHYTKKALEAASRHFGE